MPRAVFILARYLSMKPSRKDDCPVRNLEPVLKQPHSFERLALVAGVVSVASRPPPIECDECHPERGGTTRPLRLASDCIWDNPAACVKPTRSAPVLGKPKSKYFSRESFPGWLGSAPDARHGDRGVGPPASNPAP
jgi:hypothetical protein